MILLYAENVRMSWNVVFQISFPPSSPVAYLTRGIQKGRKEFSIQVHSVNATIVLIPGVTAAGFELYQLLLVVAYVKLTTHFIDAVDPLRLSICL